jgi:hypothetical protein
LDPHGLRDTTGDHLAFARLMRRLQEIFAADVRVLGLIAEPFMQEHLACLLAASGFGDLAGFQLDRVWNQEQFTGRVTCGGYEPTGVAAYFALNSVCEPDAGRSKDTIGNRVASCLGGAFLRQHVELPPQATRMLTTWIGCVMLMKLAVGRCPF